VYPGKGGFILFACELQLTQHFVAALDASYVFIAKTPFQGYAGTVNGRPAMVGLPSGDQLSFTPALEYNLGETSGILAGLWFSTYGHNSSAFMTPCLSFYINF
jgi:hypothetical protein